MNNTSELFSSFFFPSLLSLYPSLLLLPLSLYIRQAWTHFMTILQKSPGLNPPWAAATEQNFASHFPTIWSHILWFSGQPGRKGQGQVRRKKEMQGEGDKEQRKMKSESTCTVTLPIWKLYINAALPRWISFVFEVRDDSTQSQDWSLDAVIMYCDERGMKNRRRGGGGGGTYDMNSF